VALVIIAKGLWVSAVTADRIVLQDWITRSTAAFPDEPPINPQDLDVVSSAATLFGLGAGAVLLHRWGKFSATGSLTARAARFALGLVGVIVIYFGLRMILPSATTCWPSRCASSATRWWGCGSPSWRRGSSSS